MRAVLLLRARRAKFLRIWRLTGNKSKIDLAHVSQTKSRERVGRTVRRSPHVIFLFSISGREGADATADRQRLGPSLDDARPLPVANQI